MVRANQFVTEAVDSDAMNELKLFIANDEDLYRRQFMPIVANIKRKIKRGVYNHEMAPKLWMYLVDNAAKKYVKEFGSPEQDVKDMFPKELRTEIEQNCDYVGNQFAEEARKIHYGEAEEKSIYGEASLEDAKTLLDEGVDFTPIPWLPKENS